ncbi:DUF6346 domain-containing protein [Micromonospora sp. NPDC049275]|uniref:DUF6346 domain-containing protein n=1 Tax=Micromonospora sp. NPDC049275 TaxID=3364268 RepID=UPI00371DFEA2
MNPDIRDREMRLWESLGPAGYRLRCVGVAALLALAGIVSFLTGMTVASLFPGTGAVFHGPGEHPVIVVVDGCQRVGPISSRGFGYWWECDATVTAMDGAARKARIESSVVTPEDQGRPLELREGCRDESGLTDCTYGRPTNGWLEVGVLLISKLGLLVAVGSGVVALVYLTRAALGAPRYCRFRGGNP